MLRNCDGCHVGGMTRLTHAIGEGLGTLDREVFEAIAESPSPLLDAIMPRLTRAADHSKLWLVHRRRTGAHRGRRAARRGAARGVLTLRCHQPVHQPSGQADLEAPDVRTASRFRWPGRSRRTPTSNSLPSGHSASAAAFAVGVGLENATAGPGTGAACRPGGAVPRRHRRALSRRRVRGVRHRRRRSRCSARG